MTAVFKHISRFLAAWVLFPALASAAAPDTLAVTGAPGSATPSGSLVLSPGTSRVSVAKEGQVTLTASKSITFLPGTKITAGSFLYASIEPASKTGTHRKRVTRLVTVEEKMKLDEQASLSRACEIFTPFPARKKGDLHAGDPSRESFSASGNELSGVSPEQQRKVAADNYFLIRVTIPQTRTNDHPAPATLSCRAETTRVLRL